MFLRKKTTIVATLNLAAGILIASHVIQCSADEKTSAEVSQEHHASTSGKHKDNVVVATESKSDTADKKKLLFFMNPNGRPCQMQDAIIQKMGSLIAEYADVRYVKTSEPADRSVFGQYGVRGLPSLIIIDKDGKELKRFTPGVKEENAIVAALQ